MLYRVRGEIDPLRANDLDPLPAPLPLTEASRELDQFLRSKGLHPYQLPLGCEQVPECLGCQGFLCPKACKNDSKRICLDPAIQQYGAQLLDECRVVRLEADHDTVTGVICVRRGEEFRLLGTNVVLAAGPWKRQPCC